ncbi:MAG: hypothetical protein ACLPN5_07430 [Roseiarcus sp.]
MVQNSIAAAGLAVLVGLGLAGAARADCESDLQRLEAAYQTP